MGTRVCGGRHRSPWRTCEIDQSAQHFPLRYNAKLLSRTTPAMQKRTPDGDFDFMKKASDCRPSIRHFPARRSSTIPPNTADDRRGRVRRPEEWMRTKAPTGDFDSGMMAGRRIGVRKLGGDAGVSARATGATTRHNAMHVSCRWSVDLPTGVTCFHQNRTGGERNAESRR